MRNYAQHSGGAGRERSRRMLQGADGRGGCERTRAPKPPRSVATRAEIGPLPARNRSYSAPRSVATRTEIGRNPHRDRSQPAPRSVRFRLEIGRTIPGGADQPEDGKRPPNHYASTTRRAAAQTFSLLFYDFMAKHLLITTLHRRILTILTIRIILGANTNQ